MSKYLFWNINKKNLAQELIKIVFENHIDILMLAEAENLDVAYLISGLKKLGRWFKKKKYYQNKEVFCFCQIRILLF